MSSDGEKVEGGGEKRERRLGRDEGSDGYGMGGLYIRQSRILVKIWVVGVRPAM